MYEDYKTSDRKEKVTVLEKISDCVVIPYLLAKITETFNDYAKDTLGLNREKKGNLNEYNMSSLYHYSKTQVFNSSIMKGFKVFFF